LQEFLEEVNRRLEFEKEKCTPAQRSEPGGQYQKAQMRSETSVFYSGFYGDEKPGEYIVA
jgi:hypothetical protein